MSEGWTMAGRRALARGDHRAALDAFEHAVAETPGDGGAMLGLGRARLLAGEVSGAAEACRRAADLQPGNAEAWRALAESCRFLDRLDEALDAIARAAALAPDDGRVLAQQLHVGLRACAWEGIAEIKTRLMAATVDAINAGRTSPVRPFVAATCFDDPAFAHLVARSEAVAAMRRVGQIDAPPWHRADGPLTIGYLSAGFGAHPTGHLLRRMFACHDRDRFRIVGLALNRDDGSTFRRDMVAGCDTFVPLHDRDDDAAVLAIRGAGVDILVDLHGWLQNHRMAILARRPAPAQVTWLGFPGTTGAPFVDWLVGDAVVTPAADQSHFTERLVRLPGTYQANDPQPDVAAASTRREHGLPEEAIVLACFNVAYKIDPESFALFCEVLRRAPGSVLWLLETNTVSRRNLTAAATRAGVDPARLVFAPFAPKDRHLARLALADIALDTGICNGHTTTTDALWAGVPVVARRGRHFASRVAASLLGAAGLDDLVCKDSGSFVATAVSLARDGGRRRRLARQLGAERSRLALFDLDRFVRHLEAGLLAMASLRSRGLPAAPLDVGASRRV